MPHRGASPHQEPGALKRSFLTRTHNMMRAWLILSNATMMMGWANVLVVLSLHNGDCEQVLTPRIRLALLLSFLELFNAIVGCTRSKPHHVLLFSLIRFGVENLVAPLLSCDAWQHVLTVASWSAGDTVRFGCFFLDHLVSSDSDVPKRIRYSIGPILFPCGALGEMLMVIAAASSQTRWSRLAFYGASALWPVGFYFLYTQLLRQRRKFFAARKARINTGSDTKKKTK